MHGTTDYRVCIDGLIILEEKELDLAKKVKIQEVFETTVIFICLFLILTAFWKNTLFASDEEEIFVKGQQIARGLFLYKNIASQHMPIMYFLAALFSRLGVSTITGFRLCFYMIMALIWALMYHAYKDRFGRFIMIGYPLIYIGAVADLGYGTCILSEQLQGQGMVILFLELMLFSEYRSIRFAHCCMISLAILLSLGNAFVSVFGIFFIAMTVLAIEIRELVNSKDKFIFWKHFLGKYALLVTVVSIPWIGLVYYFIRTHTLQSFFSWAYVLNRTVYPRYTTGYGNGIVGGLFGGISHLGESVNLNSILTFQMLRAFAVILLAVLFLINLYTLRKDKLLVIGLSLFVIGVSTRGAFNTFHGLPACAILSAMAACYIKEKYELWKHIKNWKLISVIACMVFFSGYISMAGSIFSVTTEPVLVNTSAAYYQRKLEKVLDDITEDYEGVGFSMLNYDILMNAHVLPASVTGGSCPWLWDWGGKQAMEELTSRRPRVFLYSADQETWGYPIKEYALDLAAFLKEYYTQIVTVPGLSYLYIRNDVFADVYSLINKEYIFKTLEGDTTSDADLNEPVKLENGVTLQQFFTTRVDSLTDSITCKIETYGRINDSHLSVCLKDETTGEEKMTGVINCADIKSPYVELMGDDTIVDITQDHRYSLTISCPDARDDNFIGVYHDNMYASSNSYSMYNNCREPFNLNVEIKKKEYSFQ